MFFGMQLSEDKVEAWQQIKKMLKAMLTMGVNLDNQVRMQEWFQSLLQLNMKMMRIDCALNPKRPRKRRRATQLRGDEDSEET